ncbi:bifunctional DNA primase/polymerase [Streptomyces sp. ISL-11]|uniref:bifunctional DNA primase/polymerase n=1 Tax=Streptomyces sp. ISL-11 TaxID=2819174 RepID=UPI001BE83892|nr:bifunctional DNA primase/polymerase [Streptomyces sp. ISL-11]MBT2382681.1 bifunctional DNA primase/polymerase [Streptomyces sp. ISL-11]
MSSRQHDPRPSHLSTALSALPSLPSAPSAPSAPSSCGRTALPSRLPDPFSARPPAPQPRQTAAFVTLAGADWLASASRFPSSVHALWAESPGAPLVLPCGGAFDVVSVPALFGRRMLDRLWAGGPGSGPVAAQRGRLLLFAAPGTAQRLPALLTWEEWARAMPPLLCHGTGDAVTVPPLWPAGEDDPTPPANRWLVAPEVRHPWLPDAEVLLWACVRVARATAGRGPTAPGAPVTSTSTLSPR